MDGGRISVGTMSWPPPPLVIGPIVETDAGDAAQFEHLEESVEVRGIVRLHLLDLGGDIAGNG